MKRGTNTNSVVLNKFVLLGILLFFVGIIFRMVILSVSTNIDGVNLQVFASNRNTKTATVYAKRGTIYDKDENVLAQTINSYTVIAFLDPSRSEGFSTSKHVVDKEYTAEQLSPIIGMSKEAIMYLLNKDAYQVELGPGGRGITELTKDRINELNLSGIGFLPSYKRYYPNGNFSSYILGYVQTNDDGDLVGEMGIELAYDTLLKGENGYSQFQQDLNGYKIPNTPEITKESVDGVDIYLTIDSNIQFFAERNTASTYELYSPEWVITVVADAKTGAILASTSYPSFDPNIKNISNYLNPLVSFAFEPGSTMKTYTYMAVMEKGVYNPNEKFESGSVYFGNEIISDWKREGWGMLTYDQGYTLSANTGISSLVKKYISGTELKEYYEKLGFGKETDSELLGEASGKIDFYYPFEVASAGFGQGITTTPIQNIQALTAVANDGILLKPYLVEKVVDSNTDSIVYYGSKTELGRVASTTTTDKIKDLMYDVVNGDVNYATGSRYKQSGYDVIAKTGTAQYINASTNRYYSDDVHYIRSFAGMFPKDNPEYIIYVAIKRPFGGSASLYNLINPLIRDIANYKGINNNTSKNENIISFEMPNLLNKDIKYINEYFADLTDEIEIIGDGTKIINQYPKANTTLNNLDKIFIVTDSKELNIGSLKGWSLKEVKILCELLNLELVYEGSGYVTSYDLSKIDKNKISVKLENSLE